MRKRNLFICVFLILCFLFQSCQNDDDEINSKQSVPINYSFKIPNKLNFNFYQKSASIYTATPYSNILSINNISSSKITSNINLFAFKNDTLNYENLFFIKEYSFSDLAENDTLHNILLEDSNTLFSKKNLIISILNINNNKHMFSGFYSGELNVYDANQVFLRSLRCTGTVDYQGEFNFFTEQDNEVEIVFIKGSFNSVNLISGKILNNVNDVFSQIKNDNNTLLQLNGNQLKGQVIFTNNGQDQLLEFNIIKQN